MVSKSDFVVLCGDAEETLKTLPDESVQCCITSPPYYGLRNYGIEGQVGAESSPEEYVERLVSVFREVKRVLKNDGTVWLNIGDTYNVPNYHKDEKICGTGKQGTNRGTYDGVVERRTAHCCKPKDMIGIPWMVAFALRNDGWYLRQDIIWAKSNGMPEPVTDRCVKSHEYIFLLSKSPQYLFNPLIEVATGYDGRKDTLMKGSAKYREGDYLLHGKANTASYRGHERWRFKTLDSGETVPIRTKRDVWNVPTGTYAGAHFATYPEELITPCVLAGTNEGDTVLDPFSGSGTTGIAAVRNGRKYLGIELNSEYIGISYDRFDETFNHKVVRGFTRDTSEGAFVKNNLLGED